MRILLIVLYLFIPFISYAADTSVPNMTAVNPSADDLLYVVDDPGGTPADRKSTVANLFRNSAGLFASITDESGTGVAIGNSSPTLTSPTVGTSLTVNTVAGAELLTAQAAGVKVTGGLQVTNLVCNGFSNGGALTTDSTGNLLCSADDTGGTSAPADATYVTLSTNATLSDERVLTAGTGIATTDAGAGSTITVARSPLSSVTEFTYITDESGTGVAIGNSSPTMTSPTINTTFTFTSMMTGAVGGINIDTNVDVDGLINTALDCTGNSNGGAITTDANGFLSCSNDDTASITISASDPLAANNGNILINSRTGTYPSPVVLNDTPTITSPTVNTSFTFTSMMTGTTGGVVVSAQLAIPNGANPTVDGAGDLAIDTTRGQLLFWSSPTVMVIPPERTKCAVIENLAAADDDVFLGSFDDPVTVTKVGCRWKGTGTTKATIQLHDGTGNNMTHTAPTCTPYDGVMTSLVVTAGGGLNRGEGLAFDVTNAISPETDEYEICIGYTFDRQ